MARGLKVYLANTTAAPKGKSRREEEAVLDREKRMQEAMLSIKKKFGKNAVLKGMNLQKGAQPPGTEMNKLADIRRKGVGRR